MEWQERGHREPDVQASRAVFPISSTSRLWDFDKATQLMSLLQGLLWVRAVGGGVTATVSLGRKWQIPPTGARSANQHLESSATGGNRRKGRVQKTEVARQGRGRGKQGHILYAIIFMASRNMLEAISVKFLIASLTSLSSWDRLCKCRSCQDPHVSALSLLHTLFLTSALFCKDAQSFFFPFFFFPFPRMLINSRGNKGLL